jgi:hypothetical protein
MINCFQTVLFKIILRRYTKELSKKRVTAARQRVAALGRAVQVEPMKPMLKAPGTMRLKL